MNKIINKDANYEAFEARLKRQEFRWIDSNNSKLGGNFFYFRAVYINTRRVLQIEFWYTIIPMLNIGIECSSV